MVRYSLGDAAPQIDDSAYVAPGATLIGDVILEAEASVWFGAVIRGDNDPIRIGAQSNVQDLAMLHTDPGLPLTIGIGVTVGHQVMLHGCEIGDGSLIGMQAIVLNRASIGRNCLVGAGTLITEGKSFPDNSLILGSPGKVVGQVTPQHLEEMERAKQSYLRRLNRYRAELSEL